MASRATTERATIPSTFPRLFRDTTCLCASRQASFQQWGTIVEIITIELH